MKKIAIFLVTIFILTGFCSCKASNNPEEVIKVNYNPKINEHIFLLSYDYQLTDTQIERGFISVEKKSDGMAVFKIKRKDYEAYIGEIKTSREEFFNEYNNGADPLIKSVAYNDDLTEIIIKVNKHDYENTVYDNGISPYLHILNVFTGCGSSTSLYLAFSTGDFKQCEVKLVDDSTGEVLKSDTYPQTLFD